jgi:hypothetical protein
MIWDRVLADVRDTMRLDDGVRAVLGVTGEEPIVGLAGSRAWAVKMIEFTVISDVEGEVFNGIRVQWDLFVASVDDLIALERACRRVLHHDLPVEFGSYLVWSQIVESRSLPGPTEDGVFSKSLDQLLTAVRSKYQPITES